MKIRYQREGGIAYFPGLSQPIELDTAALPAEQAEQLERLCAAARIFERPQAAPLRPGSADIYHYTLTVRRGRRGRTLRLHDPIEDSDLLELINYIEELRR